jgi:hypothetical protein
MGWMAPLRHLSAKLLSDRNSSGWEPSMGEVTTIGLDLAKQVFQVHGVDAGGATVLRKQLRRAQVLAFFNRLPPCLVGLEACATAPYWARELRARFLFADSRVTASGDHRLRGGIPSSGNLSVEGTRRGRGAGILWARSCGDLAAVRDHRGQGAQGR